MNIRIYESRSQIYFEYILVLLLITLGILFLFYDAEIIGLFLLCIACFVVPVIFLRKKQELFYIELNDEGVLIPYRDNGLSIKWEKATYGWSEIESAKINEGFPRNGYVPIFLIINLQSAESKKFILPILKMEFETVEKVLTDYIKQYNLN